MKTPPLKSKLEFKRYARKRIYHGCLVRIDKSVPQDHCLASQVKPRDAKQSPSDRFFYLHLTTMKDSYILTYKILGKM